MAFAEIPIPGCVNYPIGPPPAGDGLKPGEGINIRPFDTEIYLDFTGPLGKCTGLYYNLVFQLSEWGFQAFKVGEDIFVSPSFKPYYDLTIGEKNRLEAEIKTGLASIAQAVADFDLLLHDLRKYEQFLEYYEQIKKGEKLIKEGKKEEGEKLKRAAEQTLRSIFIDEVDAHTDLPNTPVALRSIVTRWPTIISDFMKLSEETTPEEIKLEVPHAEKIVLATKNKLFLQWKKMFEENVQERYRRLKELLESRKASIREYKEMLRPKIATYKMIKDMLSSAEGRKAIFTSFFHPEAQALSIDSMTVWAWRPFAPEEKYKFSEIGEKKISLQQAGFTLKEIEFLKKVRRDFSDKTDSLPIEPSIDGVVRRLIPQIEKTYNVKITPEDIYEARKRLLNRYKSYEQGTSSFQPWVFSPYFVFLEIPMTRYVLKLPDGGQLENLVFQNLKGYLETQNIIIARLIEVIAIEKTLESEIATLMGEFGIEGSKFVSVEEMIKEEFPNIYGEPSKESEEVSTQKKSILDMLPLVPGIIRLKGPYEFSVYDRLGEFYLKYVGTIFKYVKEYLMASFGVPEREVKGII